MPHYDWLGENFSTFTRNLGIEENQDGLISAHGDKCYCYRYIWEDAKIPFHHGVAIYLLTRIRPWSKEVEQTKVGQWVIDNYSRFSAHFP